MTTSGRPDEVAMEALSSCSVDPAVARVPLVALLTRGEAFFIAEFDRRIRGSEFCALSLAHSRNVLRHLGEGPMRASELVERCDVSKQAISQQIAHLAANDYVALDADPRDARARLVRLTTKGERAQQLVRGLFVEIERDWARQFGVEEFDSLRDLLSRLLVQRVGDARY